MPNGSKPNGTKANSKWGPAPETLPTLEELELLIDALVSTPKGKPLPVRLQSTLDHVLKNRIETAADLAPAHDRTEQLRLALRLLECNDLALKQESSSKNRRVREVDL